MNFKFTNDNDSQCLYDIQLSDNIQVKSTSHMNTKLDKEFLYTRKLSEIRFKAVSLENIDLQVYQRMTELIRKKYI